MADTSPHLALPYLAPAQAQKHVTHNEALQRLDILVQLRVQAFDATEPPALPQDGTVYALGVGAQDAWAGQDGQIAAFTDGAWLFIAPQDGWIATDATTGALRVFQGTDWTALPLDNLAGVGINATADAINRLAVAAQATLLSHAGAGHQLKINKATTADTASLLFQSGWSGRAEMGLAGSDAFTIKVSPAGSTWITALRIDPATGNVGIGAEAGLENSLSVATSGMEPTIQVRNTGGIGGAAFRLIDDLSGGDWKFKTTNDGSFKLRDQSGGVDHISLQKGTRSTDFAGPVRPGSFSVATLPAAASVGAGATVYVSNAAGGAVLAFSDGSVWRRCTDRTVVS